MQAIQILLRFLKRKVEMLCYRDFSEKEMNESSTQRELEAIKYALKKSKGAAIIIIIIIIMKFYHTVRSHDRRFVVVDKVKKETLIIDMAILGDTRVCDKE